MTDPRFRQRGRPSLAETITTSLRTQATHQQLAANESRATREHAASHPGMEAGLAMMRRGLGGDRRQTPGAKLAAAHAAIAKSKEPAATPAGRSAPRPMTDDEVVDAIANELAGAGRGALRDADRSVAELLEAIQFAARSGVPLDVGDLSPAAAKLAKLSSEQLAQYARGVEQGWQVSGEMDEAELAIEESRRLQESTGLTSFERDLARVRGIDVDDDDDDYDEAA